MADENEVKALVARLWEAWADEGDLYPVAREALRWRDETRPVQAPPAAVAVPEVLVRAYFHRFSEVEDDYTIYHTLDGVCEQCIPVLIVKDEEMLAAAREWE